MADTKILSEVTGSIWKILVNVGDKVAANTPVALIESMNPDWRDLADRWFAPPAPPDSSLRSE